jgi:hypothetical protein
MLSCFLDALTTLPVCYYSVRHVNGGDWVEKGGEEEGKSREKVRKNPGKVGTRWGTECRTGGE